MAIVVPYQILIYQTSVRVNTEVIEMLRNDHETKILFEPRFVMFLRHGKLRSLIRVGYSVKASSMLVRKREQHKQYT